jgi:CheY-like chemotaxis protein
MKVVLLSSDLVVASRVEGAAAQVGATVRAISSVEAAIASCGAEQVELLIIDLAMPSLDVGTLVNQLRADASRSVRIVAFGPHVHEGRLAAAREAGCDTVMSRGQFFAQITAILAR